MPPLSRAVIETLVKEHRVVLFSKTWCPFCNKVKELFNSKFIPFHKIELGGTFSAENCWKIVFRYRFVAPKLILTLEEAPAPIFAEKLQNKHV